VPLSEPKGVRGEVGGRVGGSFWTPGGTNSSKFRSLRSHCDERSTVSAAVCRHVFRQGGDFCH
jgi:hypothetical protein